MAGATTLPRRTAVSPLLVADVEAGPEPGLNDVEPGSRRAGGGRLGMISKVRPEWAALVFLMTTWAVVFGRLAMQRHNRYGSFSLDMAIFDQATWLISKANGLFMSIRGLHFFGHHANMGLFLLAPFYWLGPGGHLFNPPNGRAEAAGGVPRLPPPP